MNVVFNATYLERLHLVFSRNAAQLLPDAVFDPRMNPALSILGAEHEMEMERRVSVGHGMFRGVVRVTSWRSVVAPRRN